MLVAPLRAKYPAVRSIGRLRTVWNSSALWNCSFEWGSVYGAIRPEMSEYFLAGTNEGGALMEESKQCCNILGSCPYC